jgi:hypothetical protein
MGSSATLSSAFAFARSCSSVVAAPAGGATVLGGVFAVFGDLAGLRFGLDDVEDVTGLRRAVEAQDLHRHGWPGFLHAVALVVDQRADLAPLLAHDEDVALLQRALLHQHGRNGAAAHVKLRLDHRALCGRSGLALSSRISA